MVYFKRAEFWHRTGCFDPQEVVRLQQDMKATRLRYGPAAAGALLKPELLAARECRNLKVGQAVLMVGRKHNAIVDRRKGEIIEGIQIFVCDEGLKKDPGCFDRDWDLPGAGTGLWFPFDMLSEIKK